MENIYAVRLNLEALKSRRLVIPCFQRPYRWSKAEASILFDDLVDFQKAAKSNPSLCYSFGTVVTARLGAQGGALSVLDGQQRLTTIALLENLLERRLKEKTESLPPTWLNYENLPKGMHFPSDSDESEKEGMPDPNRVTSAFTACLDELDEKAVDNGEPQPNSNGVAGASSEGFIKELLGLLRTRVVINFVDVPLAAGVERKDTSAHIEAAAMFENVNVRGVPLTNADILKAQFVERMNASDATFFDQVWSSILKALAEHSAEFLPDLTQIKFEPGSTSLGGSLDCILEQPCAQQPYIYTDVDSNIAAGGGNVDCRAALDATMLLVTARLLWKMKVAPTLVDYLTRSEFLARFEPLLSKDENKRNETAWQFLHLMLACARFVLEWCPKSSKEGFLRDEKTAQILETDGCELLETFMAESSGTTGQYWILLGVLLYLGNVEKNGGLKIENVTSREALIKASGYVLKDNSQRKNFGTDLVKHLKAWGAGLAFEKGRSPFTGMEYVMNNMEPPSLPDSLSTELWTYPGRRELFWTDWLIRCDSRHGFNVMRTIVTDRDESFFKELAEKIGNSRITFRGAVEHWVPQVDGQQAPEALHAFGNLALIDASLNSILRDLGSKKKAERVLKRSNQSAKLWWLALWSQNLHDLNVNDLPDLTKLWDNFAVKATRTYVGNSLECKR